MGEEQQAIYGLDRGRFAVQGVLGRGASGTVYRAYDRSREALVAIKVLSDLDATALFRFKAEFRSLTDYSHPNLLQLRELLHSDNQWLLTMELVEGCDFLSFVRPDIPKASSLPSADYETEVIASGEEETRAQGSAPSSAPPPAQAPRPLSVDLHLDRLRDSLRQLCEGLHALHRGGRLHCDLKPHNVLVFQSTGRLVICDFGLAQESRTQVRPTLADNDTCEVGAGARQHRIAGTLAYMSPEQAMGLPLSEPSDWYSVGVMLYQALTGRTPFNPRLAHREALAAKLLQKPLHPSELSPQLPSEWGDLALDLLAPFPGLRPVYREVVDRLEPRDQGTRRLGRQSDQARAQEPFRLIGRDHELHLLIEALGNTRRGAAGLVFVSGSSGMGKSALVSTFLDQSEREGALVLRGRCYQHEELPYKAFDSIMDALSSYLLELGSASIAGLLGPGIDSLRVIFPVLERVPAIKRYDSDERTQADAFDVRRAALSAFRELMRRLGQRQPVIFYIDDLQWGDVDSAQIFRELLHEPDPPALLIVCAHRAESQSALLELLNGDYLSDARVAATQRIELTSLDPAQSKALAVSLLGELEDADSIADWVAGEAKGTPFFISELAAYALGQGAHGSQALTLDAVLAARLSTLSADGWRLLSVLAVAGRPQPRLLLQGAAALQGSLSAVLHELEAQRLVISAGSAATDKAQIYHDRIREAVYERLSDSERCDTHRRVAEAMELSAPEPEALCRHWRAAGEPLRAAEYALQAAQAAESSLAFDRAASLYEEALALLEPADVRRVDLTERHARALMYAGRAAESARVFFAALEGAPPERAAELRGLAITQLMYAGQLDQAMLELGRAKHLLGLAVPTTELHALRMLLWRRLLIALRGKRLRVRAKRPVNPALLERMSTLWAVGAALSGVDLLRSSVYQAELVWLARRAGDPYHLACALSLSTTTLAAEGKDPGRVDWLFERAQEMAGLSDSSYANAVVKGTVGVSRMLQGRFAEAARLTRESQALVRGRPTVAWDRVSLGFWELQSSAQLGNVQDLVDRVPAALRDADARGDLLAATLFRSFRCSWAFLGPDEPEQARAQAMRAAQQWRQSGYGLPHYYVTHSLAESALYSETELEAALQRIEREWKPGQLLRNIQHARIELTWLRARLTIALAQQRDDPQLRAQAGALAQALQRERVPWAQALSRLVAAAVCVRQDQPRALQLLGEAAGIADATDMTLIALAARAQRAKLERSAGQAAAHAEILRLGATRPERFVRMLVPGF